MLRSPSIYLEMFSFFLDAMLNVNSTIIVDFQTGNQSIRCFSCYGDEEFCYGANRTEAYVECKGSQYSCFSDTRETRIAQRFSLGNDGDERSSESNGVEEQFYEKFKAGCKLQTGNHCSILEAFDPFLSFCKVCIMQLTSFTFFLTFYLNFFLTFLKLFHCFGSRRS